MALFTERLMTLRERLRTEENLSNLFKYFMDNLAEDPEFRTSCELTEFDMLFEVMSATVQERIGKQKLNKSQYLALKLPEDPSFYHAVCGKTFALVVMAFYFEDLGMGLIACSGSAVKPRGQMIYGRFTTIKTTVPKDRLSITPDQSRRLH
ncbi:MAG: hypothetical protein HQL60_00195 [Magnetococcales bacterium]|nr:hypothetical protein [Magnetococcales bacterium]